MKTEISKLFKLFKNKGMRLALAESVTCGLAAHQLSILPGTTEVFDGGIVSYSEEAKSNILKVPKSLIEKYTAESQEVTDAMAKGLQQHFSSDVFAAITGLASPGGSESRAKPVGTVFFTVLYDGTYHRLRKRFLGTPLEVKRKACKELYAFIVKSIGK